MSENATTALPSCEEAMSTASLLEASLHATAAKERLIVTADVTFNDLAIPACAGAETAEFIARMFAQLQAARAALEVADAQHLGFAHRPVRDSIRGIDALIGARVRGAR